MRRVPALLLAVLVVPIFIATTPPAAAGVDVVARTWVLMDADTGEMLTGNAPRDRAAMASLTKLLTALVAAERADLALQVTIVRSDLIRGSSAGLRVGERLSLRTLLYGLLLPSGNDAALAIARAVGGSPTVDDPAARERFVGWMNERAASLGLTDTQVANPHGLDARDHASSAHDLAVVTRAVLASPIVAPIFSARDYSAEGHHYESINELPRRYPGIIGGKTGWTRAAGHCLVEVAERDGRRLIAVLLGSTAQRWYDDAIALLDYGATFPSQATTQEQNGDALTSRGEDTDDPVNDTRAQGPTVWGPPPHGAPRLEPDPGAAGGQHLIQWPPRGLVSIMLRLRPH